MGWSFTSADGWANIVNTDGTVIRTNQQVSISPGSDGTSITVIMGSHTQGFQISEIDTIAGAPPAGTKGGIINQLIAVFPDALADAVAGAVKSVNNVTPDSGGNVTLTATDVGAIPTSEKGQANGIAPLGADGKVDSQYLNISGGFTYKGSWDASTNTPTLTDGVGTNGDLYKVSIAGSQDLGSGTILFNVGDHMAYVAGENKWENFGASEAVSSVNGKTGVVVLDKSDIGLSNVDNTSDANKPISTSTQAGLDQKVTTPNPLIASVVLGTTLSTNVLGLVGYSQTPTGDNLAMYNFGGQVKTAAPQGDDDAATKKYVDDAVNAISPGADGSKLILHSTSGDGVTTTFNVPHGLTNPTMVIVMANSENAKNIAFAEINGPNVEIVYDSAPILDASPNLFWTILVK